MFECSLKPFRAKAAAETRGAQVTGAGRGLGRALALRFAASGCVVLCVDVDAAGNEATALAINASRARARARAYPCDVSDAAQVRRLAASVLADVGRVDVLVSNAGAVPAQPSQHVMLLAFLPHMVARDSGHVVAISSMAGLTGLAKVPYSASKLAVAGLMDALGEELHLNKHNIKVTCVHPYFIHTRPDLPEDLHLRVPELSPEGAAAEVVRAVREELASVTVPRDLLFWLHVLRALPQDARNVWRDLLHARVTPADAAPASAAACSAQRPVALEA
ncbi:Dehydrogenase/reductase SDR family protein 7-like [Gryllus bimaculatus]|nr:Dehydrogenase/reductase SDR family protein 7-like [Gryllus bimaculatus]